MFMEALPRDALGSIFVQTLVALLVIAICSRLVTGILYHSGSTSTLPYWIPYFGHALPLFYNWRDFLRKNCHQARNNILNLHVLGRGCIVCYGNDVSQVISRDHEQDLDTETHQWRVLTNVYGASPTTPEISKGAILSFQDFGSSFPTANFIRTAERMIPDLVSCNESLVDQQLWEREADVRPKEQIYGMKTRLVAEARFVQLISSFVGHTLFNAMFGDGFLELYPGFLDFITDLDNGWKFLAMGLPRWVPPPATMRAHFAKVQSHATLKDFHAALDTVARGEEAPKPWDDMTGISTHFRTRHAKLNEQGISDTLRAALDLAALHRTYLKTSVLTCWMLLHITSISNLEDRVRDEIGPFVKVVQSPDILGFSVSPRVNIDANGLEQSCPLLNACLEECLKLYCTKVKVSTVKNAFHARSSRPGTNLQHQNDQYRVDAGSYLVSVPSQLQDTLVAFDRMASEETPLVNASHDADNGRSTTIDTGKSCHGSNQTVIVLALVAGILSLWDITTEGVAYGKIPKPRASSPYLRPESDMQMTIAQRIIHSK